MDPSRPSCLRLSQRSLLSVCLLTMSYRYDLMAATVTLVLPWVIGVCGVCGLLSVLWLHIRGPLRVDYDRVFTLHDRLPSAFLAHLFLRSAMRVFWLLQSLDLLVDEYTKGPAQRSDESASEAPHHSHAGAEDGGLTVAEAPCPLASANDERRLRGDAGAIAERSSLHIPGA